MKQILSALILSAIVSSAVAQDSSFTLDGKFSKVKSGKIFLSYFSNGVVTTDSVNINNGSFAFKGFTQEPISARLTVPERKTDVLNFFLESGKLKVSGDGDSLRLLSVSGSVVNDDDKKLKAMMKPVLDWQESHSKAYEQAFAAKNKPVMDSLDEVDLLIMQATRKTVAKFVKENPNSLRGALSVKSNFAYYAEAVEVEPIYNSFSDNLKKSKHGVEIKKMIDTYRTVAIGNKAPEIVQAAPDGSTVRLSSLRGKYVLVDFWASWCGPCRRENPNVVNIYNKYNNRGFTIYGVSYDTKKDRWEKAIKDDGLTWSQVSDLQGWKNSTSEQYGIKAIPSNMILDKDGTIIAKNLFGKKLADKLAEIFP